jgi:hypothetical protein
VGLWFSFGYPVVALWFSLAILLWLFGFLWLSCCGSLVFFGYQESLKIPDIK